MLTPAPRHSDPASPLLDPRTLEQLSNLELIARRIVEGHLQGLHRSPQVGFATNFAHHRPYTPGDDIRRIDWRAFARSERFYIKQHEVNTNLRAHILLDASGSMAYRGSDDAVSKFRYAQFVAAAVAYLILNQRDSVGLITFDRQLRETIAPASTPGHLARVIKALDASAPREDSGIGPALHETALRLRGRGMIILVSDLFEDASELINALHHLQREGHELVLLQIMAREELDFPFKTWTTFENLERTGHDRRVDPAMMRSAYLAKLDAHQRAILQAVHAMRIRYALMDTSRTAR